MLLKRAADKKRSGGAVGFAFYLGPEFYKFSVNCLICFIIVQVYMII